MIQNDSSKNAEKGLQFRFQVESSDNMEIGAKILYLRTCRAPMWKTALRYLSYLCSGFILYLINIWIPSVFVFMSVDDSEIDDSEKVVIYCADKHVEVLPLVRENTSDDALKVFSFRLSKYYFDKTTQTFKRCHFNFNKLPCNQIYSQFEGGLSEQKVLDYAILYGKNSTIIPQKSCMELLIKEILTPFYVFQAYSFTIWFIDYYYIYTAMLIIFTAISIGFTLFETMRTTNKLRKLFHYEISVFIHRKIQGRSVRLQVNSSELVPGDLLEIPDGVFMPCDAILLQGSCVMNESMLTGESIPVAKTLLPRNEVCYNAREDKQHTLFAGTKCLQARPATEGCALGLVTSTGFATVKGELIRTMMFPKPTDFKFYADSLKFMSGLLVLAVIGFIIVLPSLLKENDGMSIVSLVIIKGSEIVTVAIPPALPTCIQIGISIALLRLKKNRIFCISPNKINEAAHVNVMCFDKTGTLTEDDLDLFGVRPVSYEKKTGKTTFTKTVKDISQLTASALHNESVTRRTLDLGPIDDEKKFYSSEQLMEIMASCHSLTVINEALVGDPLDIKMYRATKWLMEENNNQKRDSAIIATIKPAPDAYKDSVYWSKQHLNGVDVVKRFEFSSSLQRMSVIVRDLNGIELRVHIKGSPEKIQELCRPDTIPDDYKKVLEDYTQNGYRVLACGTKGVGDNYNEVMKMNRDDLEHSFAFAGFLVMENKLKPVTTDVIDMIQAAQVRTVMVTGDNVLTAISVAKHCHIINPNQKIFLGDISEDKVENNKNIVWKNFESNETAGYDLEIEIRRKSDALVSISAANNSDGIDDSLIIDSPNKPKNNDWIQAVPLLPEPFQANSEDENDHILTNPNKGSVQGININEGGVPFLDMSDSEDYCIAITGKAFSLIIHEVEVNKNRHYQAILHKLLKKGAVFARMHPDEKASMIKKMMSVSKNVVGMCGDGANDVGALKTAHVGISLSEAEASIAAPFTSNIQDISCVPTLLREGKAALSTSYQEFKYMALFAIVMLVCMIILYDRLMDLTDWDYYYNEIFIVLPLSSTMGMSRTYSKLTTARPSGRLISVEILTSVIGQGIIQAAFQCATFFLMIRQPWYDPTLCNNQFVTQNACVENTSMYIVTNYQYCVTAFVFMVGRPFKEPFYTNFWFTLCFAVMMVLNLFVHYNPFNLQFLYDQVNWSAEVPLELSWKNILLVIVVINTVMTFVWEEVGVRYISLAWNRFRSKKTKSRRVAVRSYEPPLSVGTPTSQNNLNHYTASEPSKYS